MTEELRKDKLDRAYEVVGGKLVSDGSGAAADRETIAACVNGDVITLASLAGVGDSDLWRTAGKEYSMIEEGTSSRSPS